MEHFVIIVKGWKLLTVITKRSILDVAASLDRPLAIAEIQKPEELWRFFYCLLNNIKSCDAKKMTMIVKKEIQNTKSVWIIYFKQVAFDKASYYALLVKNRDFVIATKRAELKMIGPTLSLS